MKSQNSKAYFICSDIDTGTHWYGIYDYNACTFSWTDSARTLSDLIFTIIKWNEPSTTTLEELAVDFPIIHQQPTPFDLAYLQKHYPEHFI